MKKKGLKKSTNFNFDYFIHPQAIDYSLVGSKVKEIKSLPKPFLDSRIKDECEYLTHALISMTKAFKYEIENNGSVVDARTRSSKIANDTVFMTMSYNAFPYGEVTYSSLMDLAERSAKVGNYDEVNAFNSKCQREIGYAKYWAIINNPSLS